MSKDKYSSIFSKSNEGYCVYYPLNIFCNIRSFENLGIFSHVTRLDQLRPSENIWWVIRADINFINFISENWFRKSDQEYFKVSSTAIGVGSIEILELPTTNPK